MAYIEARKQRRLEMRMNGLLTIRRCEMIGGEKVRDLGFGVERNFREFLADAMISAFNYAVELICGDKGRPWEI